LLPRTKRNAPPQTTTHENYPSTRTRHTHSSPPLLSPDSQVPLLGQRAGLREWGARRSLHTRYACIFYQMTVASGQSPFEAVSFSCHYIFALPACDAICFRGVPFHGLWPYVSAKLTFRSITSLQEHGRASNVDSKKEKNETSPSMEKARLQDAQTLREANEGDLRSQPLIFPFEILRSDVCGPMDTHSLGESPYFAIFIDDNTRWCELQFLRQKSDLFEAFCEVKALLENRSGCKLMSLQSDDGGEYCSERMKQYLTENGITHRLTVPRTPEQDGIAERKNTTLLEMARCKMIQSKVPMSFWAEVVKTANYIRNRCPPRSLNGKSPFHPMNANLILEGYIVLLLDTQKLLRLLELSWKEIVTSALQET
ncbi:hypothetical protein M514_27693, partial [Trichuris suis]